MPPDSRRTELADAISSKPRLRFGQLPTPLDEALNLSSRLGCRVLIKRDDQTGLALGGNKVRKLEFLIAHALKEGADTVITTGGSQSNHARITAAACRRAGLDCYLVLDRGIHPEDQGNLLLDGLFGARVRLIDDNDPSVAANEMKSLAEELAKQGKNPYIIPRGGSVPIGATGYVQFALELLEQLDEQGINECVLYLGTGSTGTHSGILAGVCAMGLAIRVEGVSVSKSEAQQRSSVLALSTATALALGFEDVVSADDVHVDDRFRGPGYGVPTPEGMEAITTAARDEGVVLDPVYTGKAMAGLIAHAREGRLHASDVVIFLHTGGAPALFAYHAEMATALRSTA